MYSINPKIWGKTSWSFLYYLILSYPDYPTNNEKELIKNFFLAYVKILPCEKCKINFEKHLEIYPINDYVLSSQTTLKNWLLTIHNEINISYGALKITWNEFIDKYSNNSTPIKYETVIVKDVFNENMRKNIKKKSNKCTIIFCIIILIIVIFLIFFKSSFKCQ